MENNKELNAAILACMSVIGSVAKDRRNQQQSYDYVSETAVLEAAQPAMVKNGLVMSLIEIENSFREVKETMKGGKLTLSGGTFVFKVEHVETGQSKLIKSMGEGMDSGDKASYKAQTGARKNALFDLFLIPRTDDPEKDEAPNWTNEQIEAARIARQSQNSAPTVSQPAKTEKPTSTGILAPKTAPVGDDWKAVCIHFGKNKDKALGGLTKKTLYGWWANWQPEPWKGKINPKDQRLRDALDAAGAHYKFGAPKDEATELPEEAEQHNQEPVGEPDLEEDDIPF